MSLLSDAFKTIRQVVLLDDRVTRLEKATDELSADVKHHELRLRQIETLIFGPTHPDNLRLPR